MEAKNHQKLVEEAQQFVQVVAQTIQQQAHADISAIVTKCLKAVFGEEAYEFKIDFQRKRNKTEAKLLFVREGYEIDPIDAAGGGVVDVASFALRVACLVLARPKRRRLLCLDEPFRFVSKEYIPAVAKMLKTLAKDLGIQVVMVTHNQNLQVGKVVEV
jgi:DNA repair exonuclease SbcCD ATPase subunit